MAEMPLYTRTQVWQRITPVLGAKIPRDAEWGNHHWDIRCPVAWNQPTHTHRFFLEGDLAMKWRVPVAVVPIAVVVELIEELRMRGFHDMFKGSDEPGALAPAIARLLYHRGEEFVERYAENAEELPQQYTVITRSDDSDAK